MRDESIPYLASGSNLWLLCDGRGDRDKFDNEAVKGVEEVNELLACPFGLLASVVSDDKPGNVARATVSRALSDTIITNAILPAECQTESPAFLIKCSTDSEHATSSTRKGQSAWDDPELASGCFIDNPVSGG